ncbi:MAG: acyltransferase, partial [Steroidobacteraceae bacterium]
MIRKIIRHLALNHNRALPFYKRINRPSGKEWANYLRRHGGLYHLGSDCSILTATKIADPQYTWIGNRVCLGSCTLICHDGSIEVLYQKYGLRIDRIGPIVIEDDVYVGESAIVLGGTTIGEGSIIGAGSVLRKSVPSGSVVMGNPAKVVAKVDDLIRFWEAESMQFPWADLIARREGVFDAAMEPELCR